MKKLITEHVYPPIPDRRFDWRAFWDGEEESPWHHGWGITEEEAIADLRRLDQERAEAEEDAERLDCEDWHKRQDKKQSYQDAHGWPEEDYAERKEADEDDFRPPWRE